jgi:hypothetical protein
MQGSLPAGWLAFTGRELNPLDHSEGFQIITSSSSLPGLFLAQHPKTYTKGDQVHRSKNGPLFKYLVGGGKKCLRDHDIE